MLEGNSHITRNLPITVICSSTRHKIINQVIYEEFFHSQLTRLPWAIEANRRLKSFGINITSSTLSSYKKEIQEGKRDPSAIANFGGQTLDNEFYTSRYGKDGMYKQFKLWSKIWVKEENWKYIGLPANQILAINKEYKNIYACERDLAMVDFMNCLCKNFSPADSKATIIRDDIFNFLKLTNEKFSIYDFDLMCHITTNNLLDCLVETIFKTSEERCIVNIATTIGRKISEDQYNNIMPIKFIEKISESMNVLSWFCDGYNDRIIPMKYCFFALERKK